MGDPTTWKPHTEHGSLDARERREPPDSVYAFPETAQGAADRRVLASSWRDLGKRPHTDNPAH